MSQANPPILAAIDLGTNNCRLLVVEPVPGQTQPFRVIDAFSRIVRLGEGGTLSPRLGTEAMARTLEALTVCREKIDRCQVTHMRAVATEACRRAENGVDFIGLVKNRLGLRLDVISSAEEARLVMLGCAPLLSPEQDHAIMFDIGGGSTELLWVAVNAHGVPSLIDYVSVPQGVVNLTEEFGGDLVSAESYFAMVARMRDALRDFAARHAVATHIAAGRVQMVGASGTVTTLAGVQRGLVRYQRSLIDGCSMSVADVAQVIDRLRRLDLRGRMAVPCIGTDRADLVVAGCAILQAIYETMPVHGFRIGDRGLREGILADLMSGVARENS